VKKRIAAEVMNAYWPGTKFVDEQCVNSARVFAELTQAMPAGCGR